MDAVAAQGAPSLPLDLEALAAALRTDLDFKEGLPEPALRLLRPDMIGLWRKAKEPAALAKAEIVVLAPRLADSAAPAPFSRAELLAFGHACAPLVGRTLGLVARCLRVNVVVVSDAPITEPERAALKTLRVVSPSVTLGEAFHVDASSGAWWSSALVPAEAGAARASLLILQDETFSFASYLAARLSGHPPDAARAAAVIRKPTTLATIKAALKDGPLTAALLLLLLLAYLAEAWAAGSWDDIDVSALQALGGVSGSAIFRDHQSYRLLSATLLHGGIIHLLFNSVALLLGGALLETTAGAAWVLVVYVVSGICGSLFGVFVNPPNVVSVGASGAIMGLLAAAFVSTFRLPAGPERTYVQTQVARFLVPSLLPLASTASEGRVDYAAHLGGVVAGVLLGLVMIVFWHGDTQRPRFRVATSGLAVLFGSLLAGSGLVAAVHAAPLLDELRLRSADVLVGDNTIPDDARRATDTVDVWGKDRPRDPRMHLYRGMRALDHDNVEAEREIRLALADKPVLHRFFSDGKLEGFTRSVLCGLLLDLGRKAEAVQEAQSICSDRANSSFARVTELGLCNGGSASD